MSNTPVNTPAIDTLMNTSLDSITTLVDEGVEIEGTIRINTDRAVMISGRVIGAIESRGPVIINVNGLVHGSIRAQALQVLGEVHRRTAEDLVKIDGPLVLCETSHLGCDAEAAGVQMAYGATIDGALRPNKPAQIEAVEVIAEATKPVQPSPVASETLPQGTRGEHSVDADFQDSVASAATEDSGDLHRVVVLNDVRPQGADTEFSMDDSQLPSYLRHRAM